MNIGSVAVRRGGNRQTDKVSLNFHVLRGGQQIYRD